jgi:hypothetical protein
VCERERERESGREREKRKRRIRNDLEESAYVLNKILSQYLLGGTEESRERPQSV